MTTELENEEILETFNLFDTNRNGTISSSELGAALRALNLNPTEKQIQEFISKYDKNKNGMIEFDDFKLLMKEIKKELGGKEDQRKTLESAFKFFDKDGNGTIEASELRRIVTKFGESLSDDELNQMFQLVDTNKDGRITYSEFIDYCTKPLMTTPMGHKKHNYHKKGK